MIAQGLLLILAGLWLLLQTLAGDLPGRVLSLRFSAFQPAAEGETQA